MALVDTSKAEKAGMAFVKAEQMSHKMRERLAELGEAFADGGQFMVNGKSGVDSNLVAFRASNRERVTIETLAQQRRSGTTGGDNYITLNAAVLTREGVEEAALAGVLGRPEVLAPMAIDYTQDYLSNSFGNR